MAQKNLTGISKRDVEVQLILIYMLFNEKCRCLNSLTTCDRYKSKIAYGAIIGKPVNQLVCISN